LNPGRSFAASVLAAEGARGSTRLDPERGRVASRLRPSASGGDMTESDDSRAGWRLAPRGDLDVATAPDLQAELDDLIERGALLVVVDLEAVTFLDSSGLRALVHGARALEAGGGRLLVENATGAVARVLELTDLLERLSDQRRPA
jgi:anti-sigma B factor antagonist